MLMPLAGHLVRLRKASFQSVVNSTLGLWAVLGLIWFESLHSFPSIVSSRVFASNCKSLPHCFHHRMRFFRHNSGGR